MCVYGTQQVTYEQALSTSALNAAKCVAHCRGFGGHEKREATSAATMVWFGQSARVEPALAQTAALPQISAAAILLVVALAIGAVALNWRLRA
jgi:hypothetical protein